jgi:hypothetical protein
MKKIFAAVLAALCSTAIFATTLSPITLLNPAGSTSGQAIVSTGASSAPAWGNVSISTLTGVVPVAKGGTNAASASGTALDNITGFAGTGFLTRTGAGTYAFQSATNGITLANLNQAAANSIVGNSTGATANLFTLAVPSCNTSVSALTWTSGAGFGCNTGLITASTVSSTYATTAAMTAAVAAVTPSVMTSYTPIVTAGTGSFTSVTATGRYYAIGKLVYFEAAVLINTVGTASGVMNISLPLTSNSSGGLVVIVGHEASLTGKMLNATVPQGSSIASATFYDATSVIVNGYTVVLSGSYVSN